MGRVRDTSSAHPIRLDLAEELIENHDEELARDHPGWLNYVYSIVKRDCIYYS